MISLDLTRPLPANTTKLQLMKGRKVSICHHCHKSTSRQSLLRCNECRHDFCPNCLDACQCYTQGGFRIGARRPKQKPPVRLALVSNASARK